MIQDNPAPGGGRSSVLLFFSFNMRTNTHLFLLRPRVFGQRGGRKDDIMRNGLLRGDKDVNKQKVGLRS